VVEVEPNEPVVSEKEGEDGREKSKEQDFNIDTQPGIPIECEQSEKVNNEKEGEEPREEVRDEGIWETPKKKHTFRSASPDRNLNYGSLQKKVGEKVAKLKGSLNEDIGSNWQPSQSSMNDGQRRGYNGG
ncbi:hypothetical protein FRX31_027971, partial [Thalictrum thalictroides]